MWLTDLCVAIGKLREVYGMTCCVSKIENNIIVMTNGDTWKIDTMGTTGTYGNIIKLN